MKTKVLVIDDDASIRESMKKVLQGEDYEVLLAADGQEAVERYNPERIDLLLLDLELPTRNGWEVFERFTAKNPSLPIIVITGHSEQYRTAAAAGVSAFMEKPLDAARMLQIIRDLLAEPKRERIRRLAGRGGSTRLVAPDARTIFEDLGARYSVPLRWEPPSNPLPPAGAAPKETNQHNER